MSVYFDVGANDGTTSARWCESQSNLVFLFEPNPALAQHLRERWKSNPWVQVFDCAISDYNGEAQFNICEANDKGCSSLLTVSQDGLTKWGGRTDMVPSRTIKVQVRRLDSFEFWDQFGEVEWLHCDAQGSDLAVLRGLGEHIKKVRHGCVEAANKADILYVGQNTADETRKYLESHGFGDFKTNGNDPQGNEVNLEFHRL